MSSKLLHLQGMRGLAISEVLLFHYFPNFFPNGYLGVDIFFVLSGYLMSMMMARYESLSFRIGLGFLYRRLKRIAPLYYFVILITLGTLYILPFSNITPNLESSMKAIVLKTNLVESGDMDYFDKLGQAKDMFTHTWSLCVEMQFYLLFPLIWWLQSKFEDFTRLTFLYVLCAISLIVYSLSEPFPAFNSVFSRIWQFHLGNVVFILQQENDGQHRDYALLDQNENSEKEFIEERKAKENMSAEWVTTSFALGLLLFSAASAHHLTQDYARFTTTVCSAILILFGKHFGFLECQAMTFLGEISYSWYLVHWPMVSAQKLLGHDGLIEMGVGIVASFVVAVSVHFLVEKKYLTWDKVAVVSTVGITICCSLIVHRSLKSYVENRSSNVPQIPEIYINRTLDELIAYNTMLNDWDQPQLRMQNCVYNPGYDSWFGHCHYEDTNPSANLSIMLTGNSWTANSAPIVHEECRHKAKKMTVAAMPGCEVLRQTERCDAEEPMINVENEKPDILFIIVRSVGFHFLGNETHKAKMTAEAVRRLKRLEKVVSKTIFVLNVQPRNRPKFIKHFNEFLRNGSEIEYSSQFSEVKDIERGRIAMKEVVAQCSKCKIYDYAPSFMFNGKYYFYHPVTKVILATEFCHLTLDGLERVRHVYTEICAKL